MSSKFTICPGHVKWENNEESTESADILLGFPIMLPLVMPLFTPRVERIKMDGIPFLKTFFISKAKLIERIMIPDVLLRIFFPENVLGIKKTISADNEHIALTFYSSSGNSKQLVFKENTTDVLINENGIQKISYPVKTVIKDGRKIYLLPFNAIMEHSRHYNVFYEIKPYDMKRSRIILMEKYDSFHFKKQNFLPFYPPLK